MRNIDTIRKELSPARREKVATRAAQLIAEEMTLQELRRARKLTQFAWPNNSASRRMAFPALKSAAIYCSQLCARRLRPWAVAFPRGRVPGPGSRCSFKHWECRRTAELGEGSQEHSDSGLTAAVVARLRSGQVT